MATQDYEDFQVPLSQSVLYTSDILKYLVQPTTYLYKLLKTSVVERGAHEGYRLPGTAVRVLRRTMRQILLPPVRKCNEIFIININEQNVITFMNTFGTGIVNRLLL